MKKRTKIPRIIEIYGKNEFILFCHFNTGEYRIIDFNRLFEEWKLMPNEVEWKLMQLSVFQEVSLSNGVLSWANITVKLLDENGQEQEYPLELDPLMIYEKSVIDDNKAFENTGYYVQLERNKAGLTQVELASIVGTSPRIISQIENHKLDNISVATLKRIFEKGFEKKVVLHF